MKITIRQYKAATFLFLVGLSELTHQASPVTTQCAKFLSSNAQTQRSHTYLNVRSHGVNLARSTPGVSWFKHKADRDESALVRVTGFYQRTTSNLKTGRYFGINDQATFAVATDGSLAGTTAPSAINGLDLFHVTHQTKSSMLPGVNPSSVVGALPGADPLRVFSLSLRPEQISYGLAIDYYQEWPQISDRFYTHLSMPIVNVQNRITLSSPDVSVKQNNAPAAALTLGFNTIRPQRFDNISRYLAGKLARVEAGAALQPGGQQQLSSALIGQKSEATGVADLDAKLGYRLWRSNHGYTSVNLGLTIPTGNRPKGKQLFEAVYGNGHHWALGLGGDFRYRLLGDEQSHVIFDAAFDYRFVFAAREHRTLGLCGYPFWGQYYLLGQKEQQTLVPAANVTTTKVRVSQRDQVDAVVALTCHKKNKIVSVGYNFYYRHKEKVRFTSDACMNGIPDGTYGVASRSFATTAAGFGVVPTDFNGGVAEYLSNDDLDTSAAATPSQISHKFYANVGYYFKDWEYPLGINVGMHYEAGTRESALSTWGVQFSLNHMF